MYKAVFIDVDGTLIRKDHSLSEATISTIKKLREQNMLVVLVSARPLSGIIPIAEKLNLLNSPIASLNGAYIAHGKEIIFNSTISSDITVGIHEKLQKYESSIIYYQQDDWFSDTKDYYTDYEQRITDVPIKIQPFDLTLNNWRNNNTGPNKILVASSEAVTNEIQHAFKDLFPNEINLYTSKPVYLEIMNVLASKLNAVKFLTGRYHIKIEETVAIGDNYNDKEMIEFAGMGVAMGNAPDDVKAAADFITETNNSDGVAVALNKIMNLT